MPEISRFYGIIIYLNMDDHNPPHLHAHYAEFEAVFDIRTAQILAGRLPKFTKKLVITWMKLHAVELMENWQNAVNKERIFKITPLE